MTIIETETTAEFEAWLQDHPTVLPKFIELSLQLLDAGHTRFGASLIIGQMRWLHMTHAWNGEYELDNNYVALLARRAMAVQPRLRGVFEIRKLRSTAKIAQIEGLSATAAPKRTLAERIAKAMELGERRGSDPTDAEIDQIMDRFEAELRPERRNEAIKLCSRLALPAMEWLGFTLDEAHDAVVAEHRRWFR